MALILSLETSASHCAVAISDSNIILFSATWFVDQSHSRMLVPLIEKALECAEVSISDLHSIAVGSGPGSYTGLRISTSTAKGLCYGLGIPLLAIGSMENMAHQVFEKHSSEQALICIDARRNEIYIALLDRSLQFVLPPQAMILGTSDLVELTNQKPTLMAGTGIEKTLAFFNHPANWKGDYSILPSAETIGILAQQKWDNGAFEDLAQFEPDYVKPVFITAPKA